MERTFKQLAFIIQKSDAMSTHYDKQQADDVTLFCMCMLDRLNFGAESLKILLEKFENKPQVDFGNGIIIRSLLLDFLIVLNAFEVFERNLSNAKCLEKELPEFCLMMLCDSVRHTLKYFEKLEGSVSTDLLERMRDNLAVSNPNCFDWSNKTQSKPTIKTTKFRSPEKLFETLMKSKFLTQYRWVYTAYLYYSKYDHFGNVYYGLSRQAKLQQVQFLRTSVDALPQCLLIIASILTYFKGENSWMNSLRKDIVAFIEENKEDE